MADTIIERTTTDTGDRSAGWAIAVIVLIAVIIIGGFFLMRRGAAAPASNPATNVQVTIPNPTSGGNTNTTPSGGGAPSY